MTTKQERLIMQKMGRKGAAVTNSRLTPEQRKQNALKAIRARWAKKEAAK